MDSSTIKLNGEALLAETVLPHLNSFVDVGANRGEWVEIVLDKLDREITGLLYEPNSFAYEQLSDRFCHVEGLVIKNLAIGEKEGQKVFYENRKASNLSSLVSANDRDAIEKLVNITTLDDEASKHGLTQIDFLKIDTEGYDLHVLKGAENLLSHQNIGVVQFEYNRNWVNAGSTLRHAINFLESFGYRVFLLKANGMYQFQYDWYGEYYEYSNFVAVSSKFSWLEEKLLKGLI
jgi:FkbM family methyltransferase